MAKILCIDDDPDICLLISKFLTKHGYEVDKCFNGNSALKLVSKNKYDVALCDFRLPDKDGLEMIQGIKATSPATQVIIITGYSDVQMAVRSIKYGAYEYVTKPIHPDEILVTIEGALKKKESAENQTQTAPVNNGASKTARSSSRGMQYVKGSSEKARRVHQLIDLVAPTNMTVVILGESGTGKEVTARIIHENSERKSHPFVAVDCGALPAELASSELFGHKKGAFTGAVTNKEGHFQTANGGTLFLDEIGNLTYENQIKLLRALQERKIRKLGDNKDVEVDVRVLVATNEDLKEAVKKGDFREDLYFRINEFGIDLPALRERTTDISHFLDYFLEQANRELNRNVVELDKEARQKLEQYFWPGNLREMRNVVRRAVLLCLDSTITTAHLPPEVINPVFIQDTADSDSEITDLKTVVERAEKKAIVSVLNKTAHNKSKAAKVLGIDRKTLYNKMSAYGIE